MAIADRPDTLSIRPLHEFDEANALWPRGDRPQAIRAAAERFRARFKQQGTVNGVQTVDLVAAGYPLNFAFGGAAKGLNPYVAITNRMVVIRYEDFEGDEKVLVWEPTVPEGSAEAPFYDQLRKRYGEWLSENVFATYYNDVDQALARCGLKPEDVDYLAFDHLHVQDVRMMLGTDTQPAHYPNAKMLAQSREVDTFKSLHPTQHVWYVEDGMKGVPDDRMILLDGDVELGKGLALLWTPGHTDGNMSLCVNTPDGIWVSSENGVAADNWHPHLSKIPGVRRWADFFHREIVMNSNTLEDSSDQYDSMIKEHAVADPDPRDPRWKQVFPSSELARFRRQWPVVPTHFFGGINYG
jgi:hypothetical protein